MTRRPNPLEARCRELAIAASVDPDSRVLKPGSNRGMPAWCDFQGAARAEQNAREAADLSASIVGPMAQPKAYTVSPLTIGLCG